jgi:hypothetical protein
MSDVTSKALTSTYTFLCAREVLHILYGCESCVDVEGRGNEI